LGGVGVAFDAEEEVGGDQDGLNGELEALFGGEAFLLGEADETGEAGDFRFGDGAAIRPAGEAREDGFEASGAGVRIAGEQFFAAGAFGLFGERADEENRFEELVLLVAVSFFVVEGFDEFVVDEADAEDFAVKEGVDLLDKLDIGVRLDDTVDDIVGATVTVTLVEAELDDEVLGDGDVEDESEA
jgi:hypothetical protein